MEKKSEFKQRRAVLGRLFDVFVCGWWLGREKGGEGGGGERQNKSARLARGRPAHALN